jgi:hypothetical protein
MMMKAADDAPRREMDGGRPWRRRERTFAVE